MIMKNFKFFAFIMALGIALTAVSCSKDDDGYDPKKDHGYDFITGGGLDNGSGSSSSKTDAACTQEGNDHHNDYRRHL